MRALAWQPTSLCLAFIPRAASQGPPSPSLAPSSGRCSAHLSCEGFLLLLAKQVRFLRKPEVQAHSVRPSRPLYFIARCGVYCF